MKYVLPALVFAALTAPALAHPHGPDDESKKVWPHFGDETDSKVEKRGVIRLKTEGENARVEEFRWSGDELPEAMKELEMALKDGGSDAMSGLAKTLSELGARFEMEEGEEGSKAFLFDGEEMLSFQFDRDVEADDRLTISSLGRNLSVERETVVKDGKTRTRIVIEMDGGEDVDIDLPEMPETPQTPD